MGQCASSASSNIVEVNSPALNETKDKCFEQPHEKSETTKKVRNKPQATLPVSKFVDSRAATLLDTSATTASLSHRTDLSSQFLVISGSSSKIQQAPLELSALPDVQRGGKQRSRQHSRRRREKGSAHEPRGSIAETERLEGSMSSLLQDDEGSMPTGKADNKLRRQLSLSSLPSLQSMSYLDNKVRREGNRTISDSSWCDLSFSGDSKMDETYQESHSSISNSIDSSTNDCADGGLCVRRSRKLALCHLLGSSRLLTDDDDDTEEEDLFDSPTAGY